MKWIFENGSNRTLTQSGLIALMGVMNSILKEFTVDSFYVDRKPNGVQQIILKLI